MTHPTLKNEEWGIKHPQRKQMEENKHPTLGK